MLSFVLLYAERMSHSEHCWCNFYVKEVLVCNSWCVMLSNIKPWHFDVGSFRSKMVGYEIQYWCKRLTSSTVRRVKLNKELLIAPQTVCHHVFKVVNVQLNAILTVQLRGFNIFKFRQGLLFLGMDFVSVRMKATFSTIHSNEPSWSFVWTRW